jgi:multiple sugar transport system permease protein
VFTDPGFLNALKNTAIFATLTVVFSTCVSLALAIFLNTVRIFKRFYRAVFFVPAIVSLVVVSLVWKLILNSDIGLLREILDRVGLWIYHFSGHVPSWTTRHIRLLDNPHSIIPLLTITMVNVWAVVGFNTVIYLAGLQGLPSYLYEASRIDGAGPFQNFRFITLPLLRPTTFFVVLVSTIDALQVFVLPNVMKRDSEATMTVVYYLYRNAFEFYNMGYASAIAYVLFALTVLLGGVLRITVGRHAQWSAAE